MGRRRLIVRLLGLATAWGLGAAARSSVCEAQISPGHLSRSHEALEGSTRCTLCHDARRGLPAAKCLACHAALRKRVDAGLGLHARPAYADCRRCHVEHQGAGYDLVWWGKAGREAFDHRETGYALEGRHGRIACGACHEGRARRSTWEAADAVAPARTYLGLATSCTACHADVHRGTRMAVRRCPACHTFEAWSPAPRFDHASTRFPLTGRHAALACARCHAVEAGPPGQGDRPGAQPRNCAGCHQDVHQGRFGNACASCHSTAGWRKVDRAGFDHDRTAYPLRGRHAAVACDACHGPGRPRPSHDRCEACHADAHLGQLATRADVGRCEACHDVSGFSPSAFTLTHHQATRYPLEGAHKAVACLDCHRRIPARTLEAASGLRLPLARRAGERPALRLRFARTRCADCHRDVHRGELERYVRAGGCESCHGVTSWRQVTFDHRRTRFALAGGHAGLACGGCHPAPGNEASGRPPKRRFFGTPLACRACHGDPHRGQFAARGPDPCRTCHDEPDVAASLFHHGRDSAFPLDGAHARLACAACHRREGGGGPAFVRYRPIGRACRDCHPAGAPPAPARPRGRR
jgi:hypothetical protein